MMYNGRAEALGKLGHRATRYVGAMVNYGSNKVERKFKPTKNKVKTPANKVKQSKSKLIFFLDATDQKASRPLNVTAVTLCYGLLLDLRIARKTNIHRRCYGVTP